jgi:hypothetical protein
MRHVSECFAGIRLVTGHGFEQLERCGHHDKDCHVRRRMSARKSFFPGSETEEEDDDDSEDEDSELEDEGPQELDPDDDDEEEEDMASDPEVASILGGNSLPLFWFICLYAMILRCTTVEENIGEVRSVLISIQSIAMFYANPEAGEDLSKLTCAFRSKHNSICMRISSTVSKW